MIIILYSGTRVDEPLSCFSCGKLGYDECEDFDASNPDQTKVCKKGEVCLIYSWDKTQNEKGKHMRLILIQMNLNKTLKI